MKQTIYIASALASDKDPKGKAYGQQVYQKLKDALNGQINEIEQHKNNVWCRDYLPVRNAKGQLVQFSYAPTYMRDTQKWRDRIPDVNTLHKELGLENVIFSDIILDGGNIELIENKAIVSDRVFRDNRKNEKYSDELKLTEELQHALAVDQLIIIPQHPFDFTGHVDGLVRFVDANTVLIHDLLPELNSAMDLTKGKTNKVKGERIEAWYYAFLMALHNVGLQLKVLPCTVTQNTNDKDAAGIYLNFLKMEDRIIIPVFGQKEDQLAAEILKKLYGKEVVGIKANELAAEGGIINCISWTKE